jgi:hypothetical protein
MLADSSLRSAIFDFTVVSLAMPAAVFGAIRPHIAS